MAGMPRDFQRSRVYSWGALFTIPDHHRMSRKLSQRACIDIVNKCCALYGVAPCPLVFKTHVHQKCAYYCRDGGYISLPPHMMRIDVTSHEAAHHIVNTLWPRSISHGPVFVRVYMSLMHHLYGMDLAWLRSSARSYGVRWAGQKYDAPVQYPCVNKT
jgi:hypothetical protein